MKSNILFIKAPYYYILLAFLGGWILWSCEDYLEPDDPVGQISNQEVFENEVTATAAITSMYAKLRDDVFLAGNPLGLSLVMGIYSDELEYYGIGNESLNNFNMHTVIPSDDLVGTIWNQAYNLIYISNAAIEGLAASERLDAETKSRLKGEALFVRALTHFYLVNLYGDIPYLKTTDYPTNGVAERMPVDEVYQYILTDLGMAEDLLQTVSLDGERIRPDRWAVTAITARVYLYMGQWQKAEMESSLVIDQGPFSLEEELNDVFLKESNEAIWQLKPKYEGDNAQEGTLFFISDGPPQIVALRPDFVQEMEMGDLRRQYWIEAITDNTSTWYIPNKYKEHQNTGTSFEYSIVFRLAEQYLIRAEARARQGNLSGAQQDLNSIRQRAGLGNITASTTQELLEAILAERHFELFTEYGQRWFDLRRTGRADAILAPIKSGWKDTDVLLPLPETELLMNPNLKPQNPGY